MRLRSMGWLVRAIGACAILATVLGVIIAPGLHGNATDAVVNLWDRVATVFAYAMAILTSAGVIVSTADLIGSRRAETVPGAIIVAGSSLLVVLLVVSVARAYVLPDSPPQLQVTLLVAVVASAVASTAAGLAVRRPHTRALGLLLTTFAFAALVRLAAWELATLGGERANVGLYAASRGVATVGVVIEGLGQLAAAVWIGTRSRAGLVMSSFAAAAAFVVTWGAALGGHTDASPLASALHSSLSAVATLPAPYALSGAASFLTVSAVLLGASALAQGAQPPTIAAAFALALVSRGAFDARLRAIAIVAAAQWAIVAAFDERILWAALSGARSSSPGAESAESGPRQPSSTPRRTRLPVVSARGDARARSGRTCGGRDCPWCDPARRPRFSRAVPDRRGSNSPAIVGARGWPDRHRGWPGPVRHRGKAAAFPPSTVITHPVVAGAVAR